MVQIADLTHKAMEEGSMEVIVYPREKSSGDTHSSGMGKTRGSSFSHSVKSSSSMESLSS